MADHILIPHGNQWLALSAEALQDALQRGDELMGRPDKKSRHDDTEPLWFTVPQVARLCNVSETHLRDEISLGKIKARRFGRSVRIHRSFVEQQTVDLVIHGDGDS